MRMLVMGLLKNDDDGEMEEMADAFLKTYRTQGYTATLETTRTQPTNVHNGIEILVLCGHSRCYVDATCKEVAQRQLGGFDLKLTTDWILKMLSAGTKEVWIWCCEAGLSERNRKFTWGKGGECKMRFTGRLYNELKNGSGLRMSVVDYVACAIWEREVIQKPKKEDRIAKEIKVKGLFKVGYIGKDGQIETFDQTVLSSANRIRELNSLKAAGKKFNSDELYREERKLETNVSRRNWPDIVSWRIVLGKTQD